MLYNNLFISLVIPCKNEELGLDYIGSQIPKCIDEIIVIDNNSVDKTKSVARKYNFVIVEEKNNGYGNACRKGIESVSVQSDYVIIIDGDGTYSLSKLHSYLDKIISENIDFLCLSRFPLINKKSMKKINYYGNMMVTSIINILFSLKLKDSQSGMYIFKYNVFKSLKYKTTEMEFSSEIKIMANRYKYLKYKELYSIYEERKGISKLKIFVDGLKILKYLLIECMIMNIHNLLGYKNDIIRSKDSLSSKPIFSNTEL